MAEHPTDAGEAGEDAGSLKLASPDILQVRGCVLGIFCGGENWTRAPSDSGAASQLPALITAVKALPPPAPQSQLSPEMIQQLMAQQGQGGAAPQGAPAQ